MHFWDQSTDITEEQLTNYVMKYPKSSVFPTKDDPAKTEKCLFNMDNTPRYSRDPNVPRRIAGLYPQALQKQMRFILIVREPVTRLLSVYRHFASQFWHDAKTGTSSCLFGRAKAQRPTSAQPLSFSHFIDLTLQEDDANSPTPDGCAGADGINYTPDTIALFQKEYGPGSVFTLEYEYLLQNPVKVKQAVATFLGITAATMSSLEDGSDYLSWLEHYNSVRVNTRAQHKHTAVLAEEHNLTETAFAACVARVNRLAESLRGPTEHLHSLVTGPNAPPTQPFIPRNFGFADPVPFICGSHGPSPSSAPSSTSEVTADARLRSAKRPPHAPGGLSGPSSSNGKTHPERNNMQETSNHSAASSWQEDLHKPVFVEHVMKTGGTYLCHALAGRPRRNHPNGGGCSFDSLNKNCRLPFPLESAWESTVGSSPTSSAVTKDEVLHGMHALPELCSILMNEPGSVDKKKDHFDNMERYDVANLGKGFWDAWQTVLMVRDPWSRFLSHFKMNRMFRKKGLSAILAAPSWNTDATRTRVNYATQHLIPGLRLAPDGCSSDNLKHAVAAMEGFDVVLNFVDFPAESTLLACVYLGIVPPPGGKRYADVRSIKKEARFGTDNDAGLSEPERKLGGATQAEFETFRAENLCDYELVNQTNNRITSMARAIKKTQELVPTECTATLHNYIRVHAAPP